MMNRDLKNLLHSRHSRPSPGQNLFKICVLLSPWPLPCRAVPEGSGIVLHQEGGRVTFPNRYLLRGKEKEETKLVVN